MLQNIKFCNISLLGDNMKKIVIIGANDFQKPLICKAKEMGYETHVFAWRDGATGEKDADQFYDISITEKERILKICRDINPEGVVTIGSDLANITVQYLSQRLGLTGNTESCIKMSTNKFLMREAFLRAGIPVPFFQKAELGKIPIPPSFPVIVKPTDRSGSRAITKVDKPEELIGAVQNAISQSFEKKAIIEQFLSGAEYSVETVSFKGRHTCLAVTKKFTTGSPHYIEVGHLQPAPVSQELYDKMEKIVFKALDALEVEYGPAHSELRVDKNQEIHIIEIGSRMGGDCIGSDLVPLSTGYDYVKMAIDIACGRPPMIPEKNSGQAAIRFLMSPKDLEHLDRIKQYHIECIKKMVVPKELPNSPIVDSGSRLGFYILQTQTEKQMDELLHEGPRENPVQIFETPIQMLRYNDGENHFFIKRDDLLPFSFGGNKVRFADKFIEDMQKKHCDSMVIYGNFHSNLCRILATVCNQLDLPCYMVHNVEDLTEEKDSCNSKLIKMMGVKEIRCTKKTISIAVEQAMSELKEQGFRPYYIYGNARGEGNECVPMEAYREAYTEIKHYGEKNGVGFDYIFLASSTNTTQSGLLAGNLLSRGKEKIVGISVSRNKHRGIEVIRGNIEKYFQKENKSLPYQWEKKIIFTDEYLQGGYGTYSEEISQVIQNVYKEDGIPLDMTYTGKAFWGMLSWLKKQGIKEKNILFLHTGGTPLFFDYLDNM